MAESDKRKQVADNLRNLKRAASRKDDRKLDISLLRQSARIEAAIKHVPEALLDSELTIELTSQAREAANNVSCGGVHFTRSEFATVIRRHLNGGQHCEIEDVPEQKFHLLSNLVIGKPTVAKTPVIGSFKSEDLAEHQARKRKAPSTQKPAGAPTIVRELDSTEGFEEQMTKQVERIYLAIKKLYEQGHEIVDYFEFVTDPGSFAETVENIFHVSFLVAQNLVTCELDEEGMPCLAYVPGTKGLAAVDESKKQPNSGKTMIMSMSVSKWQQVVKDFHIRRSVIKRVLAKC